jgi:glycosyltransferase involved in cell wall biosynthesis
MDALICHTDEAKNRLVREFEIDAERVWLIPHGPLLHDAKCYSMDASKAMLSLPQDETIVLWQGIIRPYKGLDFLLQSWREIQAKELKARLVIAGTGEANLLEAIKAQVERLGLQESVYLDFRFIPNKELVSYYQAADIVVFPYREVTASGALMTAVSFGKAIVATNVPAFRQVLRDKETALLVEYGDTEVLASLLSLLIQDPKERARLASNVASSNDFDSWSAIARRTRQCYASVLQETRGEAISR